MARAVHITELVLLTLVTSWHEGFHGFLPTCQLSIMWDSGRFRSGKAPVKWHGWKWYIHTAKNVIVWLLLYFTTVVRVNSFRMYCDSFFSWNAYATYIWHIFGSSLCVCLQMISHDAAPNVSIVRALPTTYICIEGHCSHYNDVVMGVMASQITSLTIVYSTVYSGADKKQHQSTASLAFVRGIHL